MSHEKDIPPYRCTSCLQAIPEDQEQHLLGSNHLRPKSDEADNFVTEAQVILRYANAVASMCIEAGKESDTILFRFHQLVDELTEEADRRLQRAQEALEIVWKREQQAKQAV